MHNHIVQPKAYAGEGKFNNHVNTQARQQNILHWSLQYGRITRPSQYAQFLRGNAREGDVYMVLPHNVPESQSDMNKNGLVVNQTNNSRVWGDRGE